MSWKVTVAGPAARAIAEKLPEAVATAVLDFIAGPLADDPRRIGKPLGGVLAGSWSARRGSWRIIYEIDDASGTVAIVQVGHRRNVYRRRR